MNQYLTELSRVLVRKDIKTASPENGRLPILLATIPSGVWSQAARCESPPKICKLPKQVRFTFELSPSRIWSGNT